MEFGRVNEELLGTIDFSLPASAASNEAVLKTGLPGPKQCWLGCSSWGQPGWVGRLYPPKTKDSNFLSLYPQHFNTVELNATHYRIWGEEHVSKWVAKTAGKEFRYCPKMYQGITHRGSLTGKETLTDEFLKGMMAFGEQLGPVFIQLSDHFSPVREKELYTFLSSLPRDIRFFLELRHPVWFQQPVLDQLVATLSELRIGFVLTDTAGRRDCAHMRLTVPEIFIRFVGYNFHATDKSRCNAWIHRLKEWYAGGLEQAWFILHLGEGGHEPDLAAYFAGELLQQTGIRIPVPVFSSLF